jgi:SNF2 family DNA or RNA helicase
VGLTVSRAFVPHEYQQIMLDFGLDVPRSAWFAGMGVGKTVSALTLVDTLLMVGHSDPVLVLGPKRVAAETWPTEGQKWDHLKHLHVLPVVGTPQQRRSALLTPAHIYTMNYENLPWLIETIGRKAWPFRTVVADEATRLKGFRINQGGVRARALAQVARHTDRWINLTGTPAPNGLKDLWGQFWFLDFGERLGRTFEGFAERWFAHAYDGSGIKPLPRAELEIYAAIEDITISIRPEDWFDLEKPIERVVRVQLPAAARKAYKQLEKDMFAQLACGTEVQVFNAAALTNKCRQMANGAAYTDHPNWAAVHDAKLEALDSIVNEANGMPVLVAYEFISDRERILKAFKGAVDISKPEGMKRFRAGQAPIGIAHPKSMGHGIDGLQDVTNILCYFGHGWDLELRQQILERIGPMRQKQSGHNRNVWVYSIVADETLDDVVLERHASKREVQDLLLEAMTKK